MTIIESSSVVNKPVSEVFDFLTDMNNHQQLMPENIYNWTSTTDETRFTIQNMAKLALRVSTRTANQEIIVIPAEDAPFPLELKWTVTAISANETNATLTISAELNMMMKMLASGPLQKLADFQTNKLQEI